MDASKLIDKQIAGLPVWQGELVARVRKLIHEAELGIVEEWKWDTAVWGKNGLVCAVGAFKDHLKINFFQGATLADPHKVFNSGLEAKKARSIDLKEGDKLNETAFVELIKVAVAKNAK